MQLGDGRTDNAPLLQLVRAHSRAHHVFDMGAAGAAGAAPWSAP